jgi:hypothetical protein
MIVSSTTTNLRRTLVKERMKMLLGCHGESPPSQGSSTYKYPLTSFIPSTHSRRKSRALSQV